MPERKQQCQVIDRFEDARDYQGHSGQRGGQEGAGNGWTDGRCKAAGYCGETCCSRPLHRSNHGQDVRCPGWHVHLRQRRSDKKQKKYQGEIWRKRSDHQTDGRWQMCEYDRIHKPEFRAEVSCDRIGKRRQEIRPEEKCAGCTKRKLKLLKQPQRQERLRDESAGERIKAEQSCEFVDNPRDGPSGLAG